MCHSKKHVDSDKHKHMTMKFFALSHERFPNHFLLRPPSVDGNKITTNPLALPGEVSRFDDETLGSRYVRLNDVAGLMKISQEMIQSILPSDYSNMAMETWQWKLDHLKMYFAVSMLFFKPSMLVYRTLQGKLWCKNALMIIVLNQQGVWNAESVRWF